MCTYVVFPCVDGFGFYCPGVVKCSSAMILRSEPQAQMKLGAMELEKKILVDQAESYQKRCQIKPKLLYLQG